MKERLSGATFDVCQLLGRCLIVGVGYALAVLATEMLLGLTTASRIVTLLLATLGGTLLALVLSPAAQHARLSPVALIGVVWFVLFMVEYVVGIVDRTLVVLGAGTKIAIIALLYD